MELFREESLTIQDDYLRNDPSREGSENVDVLDYNDVSQNIEIAPLGIGVEINARNIDPEDDDLDGDDDLDLDLDNEEFEDEDDILDVSSDIDPDDDDIDPDDDDLLNDDDDLDPVITPDLDDDDDFLDDDDDLDDEPIARSSINTEAEFSSPRHDVLLVE